MLAPGFVIVAGILAEGAEHAGEIVLVFEADVLLDQREAESAAVIGNRIGRHARFPEADYRPRMIEARTIILPTIGQFGGEVCLRVAWTTSAAV